MRKIFVGILIFLIVIAVLHVGLFAFINLKGKDILTSQIEEKIGIKPKIGSLSLHFPFMLTIDDFDLGNLSFAKANISVRSFNPISSSLKLNKVYIDKLHLEVIREKNKVAVDPVYQRSISKVKPARDKDDGKLSQEKDSSRPKPKKDMAKEMTIEIKDFYLKDSELRYIDKNQKPVIDLILSELNLKITDFNYPKFTKFNIDFDSSLKTEKEVLKNLITASGWVDYFNRNMDISLKVNSFRYSAFSKFYPSVWQHQNLGLEKAILSLDSKIIAEENNLIIDNLLSLEEVEFIKISEENQKELSRQRLIKTVIGLLKDKNGKSQIRLKLKTKMDAPQIDLNVLGKGLQESVPLGPKFITEQIIYKAGDIAKEGVTKPEKIPQNTIETTIDAIKNTVDKFKDIFEDQKN